MGKEIIEGRGEGGIVFHPPFVFLFSCAVLSSCHLFSSRHLLCSFGSNWQGLSRLRLCHLGGSTFSSSAWKCLKVVLVLDHFLLTLFALVSLVSHTNHDQNLELHSLTGQFQTPAFIYHSYLGEQTNELTSHPCGCTPTSWLLLLCTFISLRCCQQCEEAMPAFGLDLLNVYLCLLIALFVLLGPT